MKFKTALAALTLALAPTFALAGGGCNSDKISASSCAEGTVYDPATGTCVPQTTS